MSIKEKGSLNKAAVAVLQDLIQVNIDSYKGCREAAEAVVDLSVAEMFKELAGEREHQAEQLQNLVSQTGETPEDSGSLAGAAHRALMDLRSALSGGIAGVLSEAERGEDYIKEKYEEAISQLAGTAAADLVDRQYNAVKRSHDRVRDLRDSHQS